MITASAEELTIGYGGKQVMGPVNFGLSRGVTALLGRNGSGKTTLMRTICGIIPPLSGGYEAPPGAQIGYLGHELALAGALTVQQNLDFWRSVTSTYPGVRLLDEQEICDGFELEELLDRKVNSLSRGQRQRVDLARLAMTDPTFAVLDEPLTGLDPVYAAQTRALLTRWGEHRTVLYSTHSIPEALQLADRFLVVHGDQLTSLGDQPVTEELILQHLEGG